MGLPDGATIAEDFLQILDIRIISNNNGFTRVTVVESNGTASANDGAWMWEIRMHRATVEVLNDDGADKFTLIQSRQFISKQPGVPNLHRTVKIVLVINAQGEFVVEMNPAVEFDFVCSP